MLLLTSVLEKMVLTPPWESNAKANPRAGHLQEQAASQGDVVTLHCQVQRRAPGLPLLGVDVGARGHQQQQTRHAVAHHS